MIDLSEKKIMVTGASSGIGRATAIMLSEYGAKVVACGRNEDRLDETLSQCKGNGHMKMVFDVRDTESYKDIFTKIVSDEKKLDGLVYCAGIATRTPLRVLDESVVREMFDINTIPFFMMVAMYSKRQFNDGGSIVVMSSISAHYPQKCMCAYIASKCALEGGALTLALELADKNIRINCVAAGPVLTPMTDDVLPATIKYTQSKTLFGLLEKEDIANTIVFLLSDMSKKITGRSMYVDGGWLGQ